MKAVNDMEHKTNKVENVKIVIGHRRWWQRALLSGDVERRKKENLVIYIMFIKKEKKNNVFNTFQQRIVCGVNGEGNDNPNRRHFSVFEPAFI